MNQHGNKMKQYLEKAFFGELEAMEKCYCENSVKLYQSFKTEDYYYIIMELCDNDLSNELKKRRKGFSAKEIKSIMSQLNNAFKKMDENKIIHRDLKIENILIKYKDETKKDFIPKLCDYGFSKILKENDLTFTGLGTASTKAPEIWEGKPYNSKVDLWSVGVIIYQLHFKDLPYKGNNEKELYKQIKENVPYKKSEDLILRDLLDHLLVKDPSKRYSWEDYFNHPFFKEEKTKK
jgi:serine/threonine protein kinase